MYGPSDKVEAKAHVDNLRAEREWLETEIEQARQRAEAEKIVAPEPQDPNAMPVFMACLIAVAGWAVIEGVLWVLRHLTWAWN